MTSRQDSTPQPHKRSLSNPLKAAALLSALYFLSKLTGLFQQQVLLGALKPYATDAYNAALTLPDVVNYAIAGGALSSTFIPIFTELRERGREKEAWEFFSALATLMTIVTTTLVVICIIFAEPLTRLFTPGLDGITQDARTFPLAVRMTQIILPAQVCFYLGGLLVGVLNAQKRFGATGFTGAVYNVVAIIVAVVLWSLTGLEIAFAVGLLVGALVGNFLLPLKASLSGPSELRLRFRPNFHWRHPLIKQFFVTALPIMVGVSFPVVDQIVVRAFASYLPTGAMTHLSAGNRLMLVALSVLAQAASVAAFPFLASNSAARDWQKLADFLRVGLRRLMFITLPISTLMILTARPTVNILFGHGAFNTPEAINSTSLAYALYTLGLFAWAGQQLVARGFWALKDTRTPTIIGSVITVFFVFFAWLCVRSSAPVPALALATSIGACVHFAAMTLALKRKLAGAPYEVELGAHRIAGTLLRTFAACLVMAVAGIFVAVLLSFTPLYGKIGDLVRALLITAAALPAFALASHRFDIPEWKWLWNRVARRIKK